MAHDQVHALDDAANQSIGSLTNGKLVKTGDGTPPFENSTNTDAEVAAAVAASHAAAHNLDSHTDVTLAGLANNNVLQYNDPSSQWVNRTLAAAGIASTGHHGAHENGGADEISVAGLSGELADDQPPKAHTLDSHSDVNVAGAAAGSVLQNTGAGGWEDKSLADAGIEAAGVCLPLAGGTMTGLVTDFGENRKVLTLTIDTGTYNNWNPAGLATAGTISLASTGALGPITLTGIMAQAEGRQIVIYNRDTSNTITLKHNDAGSDAANKINDPGSADVVIQPLAKYTLDYLSTRWRT